MLDTLNEIHLNLKIKLNSEKKVKNILPKYLYIGIPPFIASKELIILDPKTASYLFVIKGLINFDIFFGEY